jgi:AraC-like DNA-binding protein
MGPLVTVIRPPLDAFPCFVLIFRRGNGRVFALSGGVLSFSVVMGMGREAEALGGSVAEEIAVPPMLEGWSDWYAAAKGWPGPPHRHAQLEANLVVEGSAVYLLGDRRYDLGEGTLVWLFPGQDHVLTGQSGDFRMWISVFEPALVRRACRGPGYAPLLEADPGGRFCKKVAPGRARRLEALFEELHEVGEEDPALHNAGLEYLLLAAWRAYREGEEAVPGVEVHPAVEKAAKILKREPGLRSVEELGRRVGLSPSRLGRLFREQTGVSLVASRNERRLERFFEVYGRGRRVGVAEAAIEAGFGSYAQFYRVFKRATGRGPRELVG